VEIDDEPDEVNENTRKANVREVNVDVTSTTAKISSQLKPASQKDDFTLDLTTAGNLEIKGLYKEKSTATNVNLEFQVEFNALVEFEDGNSNGVYDVESDSLIRTYLLNSFDPIEYYTENSPQGTTLHILTIHTTDGVFIARFYATEGFLDVNNILITPAELKIDFEIHSFPYQNVDSGLALDVRVQTNAGFEQKTKSRDENKGYAENESAVEATEGDYTAFFSWVNGASADGTEIEVKTSPISAHSQASESQKFYLNYPHATDIIHDPKIGIDGILVEGNTIGIFGIELVALAVITSIVLVVRRKREN
jgi:hypothetical protein